MKILTLIAARGGSKRIPDKNVRLLGGRPLISWSIDIARDLPEVVDVLVSTDSLSIAEIAIASGALAPWLRPANLATDTSSSVDVALHALRCYEAEKGAVDGLLLLQPTSPFRRRESLLRGIELFRKGGPRPVIGVSTAASHPLWCFRVEGDEMAPFVHGGGLHLRSQDLQPAYAVNGAFYLVSPEILRTTQSFFNDHMIPLIMDELGESVDIDTEQDWQQAEMMLARMRQQA